MAAFSPLQTLSSSSSSCASKPTVHVPTLAAPRPMSLNMTRKQGSLTLVNAVGDVSSDGTTYLIAGAAAVALLGTAFPIIFSRKDTCPECDGAGFVRKSSGRLNANAARKDQAQIVCANCNGLGKLNQVDK
ncbi:putative Heat shock protein DnaJ, cysteine-rich domain superfamily [Helianthus anomalus]